MSKEPSKKKPAKKTAEKVVNKATPARKPAARKSTKSTGKSAPGKASGAAAGRSGAASSKAKPAGPPARDAAPAATRTTKETAAPGRHRTEFLPTDPINRPQPINPSTTLIAKCNIGFGNALYLRGDGPGLSWDRGVLMDNVAADEWLFILKDVKRSFSCKLLINDEIWATGPDVRVEPGSKTVLEAFTFA